MKRHWTGALALLILCSGCGTSQTASSGDPGAIYAGASIGGNLGGAIGGLIGDSNGGRRGGYRGSAIGSIIGTIAGAAIGHAATAPKQPKEEPGYRIERDQEPPRRNGARYGASPLGQLKIRNIRFIDDNRDHVISSDESSKVIFEIVNEGDRTAHNVVPAVTEMTGMKRIYISSSVLVEQIAPHEGVKYTATVSAGHRIKDGEIVLRVAVTDEYGEEYDWQEFSLTTQR